jgi:hypothetical protein
MSFDEDAFLMAESASEESGQEHDDGSSVEESVEEDGDDYPVDPDTDNKLMEYLLKGFVLSSTCCKVCRTPLINNMSENDDVVESLVGNREKHQAGRPVRKVPFCVACSAVVVSNKDELQTLWQPQYKHLMGIEGAVILDLEDGVSPTPVLSAPRKVEVEQTDDVETLPYESKAEIKYETGDGLLVISANEDEDRSQNSSSKSSKTSKNDDQTHVSEEANDSAQSTTEEKPEIDFDLIDYKKR